jgi:hypothetical protein
MSSLLLTLCLSLLSQDPKAEVIAGFEVGGITNEDASIYLSESGLRAGTEFRRINSLLKAMDNFRVDGLLPQRRGEVVIFDPSLSKLSTASYVEIPEDKREEIRAELLTEEEGWEAEESSNTTINRSRYFQVPKMMEGPDGKVESRLVKQDRPIVSKTYHFSDRFLFWSRLKSLVELDLTVPHARDSEPNAICWLDLAKLPKALRLGMLSEIKKELLAGLQRQDDESADQWMLRAARNHLWMVIVEDLGANDAKLVGSAQLSGNGLHGELNFLGGRGLNVLMKQMTLLDPMLKKYIPANACVAGWFGADLSVLNKDGILRIVNDLSDGSGLGRALLLTDEIECAFWSVEADTAEALVVMLRIDHPQETRDLLSKALPVGWEVQVQDSLIWMTNSKAMALPNPGDTKPADTLDRHQGAIGFLSFDMNRPVRLCRLLEGLGLEAQGDHVRALDFVESEVDADGRASATLSTTSSETSLRIVSGNRFAVFVTALCMRLFEQTRLSPQP